MACKKWVKGCSIGCGSFIVLSVVGALLAYRFSSIGQADFGTAKAMAKAKAIGLPLLASDLTPKPPIKPRDNANIDFVKAESILQTDPELGKTLTDLQTAVKQKAPVQKIIEPLAKLDKLARFATRAASKPHCDFGLDWDAIPWELPTSQPRFVKDLASILGAKGIAEAKSGQVDAALKDLRAASRMGELVAETPLIVHTLIAASCDFVVASDYEQVIQAWSHDGDKLKKLQFDLESWRKSPDFGSLIPGEFYYELVYGRNAPGFLTLIRQDPKSGLVYPRPDVLKHSGEPQGRILRAMITRCIQRWTIIREELDKKPTALQFRQFLIDLSEPSKAKKSYDYMIVNITMGDVLVKCQESIMSDESRRRCLRGMVAALLYRSQHGRFPKSLDEAGFTETDPFTDQPLKIDFDTTDYRVYSVGADGVDDHGAKMDSSSGGRKTYDIVVSCPVG